MSSKIILKAEDLDGYLTDQDNLYLKEMDNLYAKAMDSFKIISSDGFSSTIAKEEEKVIDYFNEMGHLMQKICQEVSGLHVFSFDTEEESHAEASRVIAKLRNTKTDHDEFVYYTQRAYEMLFRLAYTGSHSDNKNYLVVKTPVTVPVQNYSVHKIPDIDHKINNTVMCVMLRGALLPSMIMS